MSSGNEAQSRAEFDSAEIRSNILAEINDLKATAQAFGWDAVKNGTWFNQFLSACLGGYHERVIKQGGESYLRGKYPGLPTEAIAGKLCEMAEQTAAIAGSLSGAAASGAVLTAGAGIPAAITAVMAEVLFTIRLQLRLVYDLHLVYGIPLDAKDPEDLLGIFAVVYGVKLAEAGGIGAKAFGPEVMRAHLYRMINGNTKAIQEAVKRVMGPRIARHVTQKGILKTAVPVVGVAISAGWNFTATRLMGSRVRQEVRIKAALREEVSRLHASLRSDDQTGLAIIEGLLALAIADENFNDVEREVHLSFLGQLDYEEDQLKKFATRIHADLAGVLSQLRSLDNAESRKAIGRCFCLIAASDGELQSAERDILIQLLSALGQDEQIDEAEEFCSRYRKEEGGLGHAMGAVSNAVGTAASNTSEALGSAVGWMKGKILKTSRSDSQIREEEFQAGSAELETKQILVRLAELDRKLASGEIDTNTYEEKWAELKSQLTSRGDE
jgi:tellurite resistance protein